MGEANDESEIQSHAKHIHRGRDVWTNRVIGWATGALIPILFVLIPVIHRYLDDAKELEKLRITNNLAIANLNTRVTILESELIECRRKCK